MYIYQITNLINGKIYIGQTNNYHKRWSNHRTSKNDTVISRAIQKYGVENFSFEVLMKGLTEEEANRQEIALIKQKKSKVPNGYNVADGGKNIINSSPKYGGDNNHSILSNKEAQWILDHRNIPEYVLYDEFRDKISYSTFKNIYLNKTYTNLSTTTPIYPYNFEFSCQFNNHSPLEYDDILKLRQEYEDGVDWEIVYQDYKELYPNAWEFWSIYNGKRFSLVRPEVFSEENKKKHTSNAAKKRTGENNGRAKLNKEQVINIRKLAKQGFTVQDIHQKYDFVTITTIKNILNFKTWKNVL